MANRVTLPPPPGRRVVPPPVPAKRESPYDLRVKRWVGLAATIKAGAITVEALYHLSPLGVGPAIVGYRGDNNEALPNIGEVAVPPNLSEAAVILSRAAKGNFLYFFNAKGERVAEACDDSGRPVPGIEIVEYYHYNLPFFFGLSLTMNERDWTNLVNVIETLNPPLAGVLRYIGSVIVDVERSLTSKGRGENSDMQRTPPPQVQSYVSEPAASPQPPARSRPPVPPRPPDPPPISHSGERTVRSRPK